MSIVGRDSGSPANTCWHATDGVASAKGCDGRSVSDGVTGNDPEDVGIGGLAGRSEGMITTGDAQATTSRPSGTIKSWVCIALARLIDYWLDVGSNGPSGRVPSERILRTP